MTEGDGGCNSRHRLIHPRFMNTVDRTQLSALREVRMPAYVVVSLEIKDPDRYAEYLPGAGASLQAHGGEFLAGDRDTQVLEGPARPMTVVLRFPDKAAAEAWYRSEEYQNVIHLRHESTEGTMVIADGV
jgi:uncharacterized protein (DUF1330 family)